MKITQALMIGSAALAGSLFVLPAQAAEEHVVFSPDKIQWGSAPDVLPKGAEAACSTVIQPRKVSSRFD